MSRESARVARDWPAEGVSPAGRAKREFRPLPPAESIINPGGLSTAMRFFRRRAAKSNPAGAAGVGVLAAARFQSSMISTLLRRSLRAAAAATSARMAAMV